MKEKMREEMLNELERLVDLHGRTIDFTTTIEIEDSIMDQLLEMVQNKVCFLVPVECNENGVKYPHCFIESVEGEFLLALPTLKAARYADEEHTQWVEFGVILQIAMDSKDLEGVFLGLNGAGLAVLREDIACLLSDSIEYT